MATLNTVIARQPIAFQRRYAASYWITWANDLLEELSGGGFLPDIDKEEGVIVDSLVWIDKPTGLRIVKSVRNPIYQEQQYSWKIVNNRIRLTNAEIDEHESPDTASTFSNYLTTSITVDIDDAEADQYKDYLFYITAGTYANKGYVIKSNTASSGGTCVLSFLHPLSSALDGTKVTAASLIHYDYYVLLEYIGSYDEVTAGTDELPIDNKFERRITDTYFRWKAEQQSDVYSDATRYWEDQFNKIVMKLKCETRTMGGPIQPRRIPGLDQHRGVSWFKRFEQDLD